MPGTPKIAVQVSYNLKERVENMDNDPELKLLKELVSKYQLETLDILETFGWEGR